MTETEREQTAVSLLEQAIERSGNLEIERRALMGDSQKEPLLDILNLFESGGQDKASFAQRLFTRKPDPEQFCERLHRLLITLGFHEEAYILTGLLGAESLELFSSAEREQLILRFFAKENDLDHPCFALIPHAVTKFSFPPEFLAQLFPLMLESRGKAERFYNRTLSAFCRVNPAKALEVIKLLTSGSVSEHKRNSIGFMLGTLRAVFTEGEHVDQITSITRDLHNSADVHVRMAEISSWNTTSWLIPLGWAPFQDLIKTYETTFKDEQLNVLGTITSAFRSSFLPESTGEQLLTWFESIAIPALPSSYKSVFFALLSNTAYFNQGFCAQQLERLTRICLNTLNKGEEHEDFWDKVDPTLSELVQKQEALFRLLILRLAEVNLSDLTASISDDDDFSGNRMLLYHLSLIQPWDFIHEMLLSKTRSHRRLGIFFFEKLCAPTIPEQQLAKIDETTLTILLYEIKYRSMDRNLDFSLLLSFLSQTERMSVDFQNQLEMELLKKVKNLPGKLLPILEKEEHPIAKKVTTQANEYFDRLHDSHNSPALKMGVPGLSKAIRLYQRELSRYISDYLENHSLLSKLTGKSVMLLYGQNHSEFSHGVLSQPTPLTHFSHTEEAPRIEHIAPEAQALDRLYSGHEIKIMDVERGSSDQ